MARPFVSRDSGRRHGVEQPGTIQVRAQLMLVRPTTNPLDILQRLNPSRAAIMRILNANQPRANVVLVVGSNQSDNLLGPHHAELAFDDSRSQTAQLRERTLLVVIYVTT